MSETLEWGDEQWGKVRQTVHDEALRARVAASFLPLYGPLPAGTQAVPLNALELVEGEPGMQMRLGVNDYTTRRLSTISVNVYLKGAQIADPELASALIMFRRAAAIAARLEDAIIFNGQAGTGQGPKDGFGAGEMPDVYTISGGGDYDGLRHAGHELVVEGTLEDGGITGQNVFSAVVSSIQALESEGHLGPFACVMGNDLFKAITTPVAGSMVLPRDSILPFLEGPLLRSSVMHPREAVVVSLQGAPVEIVVPSDIAVKYLQTSSEGDHVFRVQQKFLLRIKEKGAISTICF